MAFFLDQAAADRFQFPQPVESTGSLRDFIGFGQKVAGEVISAGLAGKSGFYRHQGERTSSLATWLFGATIQKGWPKSLRV